MPQKADEEKVLKAARSSIPLTVKSYTLPRETEEYLEQILFLFLREMGQEQLKDALSYCLREIAVNAKKANTKRVYFQERGLDLLDDDDYQEGMQQFKQDTLENISHYLQRQKEEGLYVKVVFHARGRVLHLYVINNTMITKKEQIRVYDRIARSRAFNSLEEALTTVLDDSEGAGLGIVILVLMLKKIGLDEDAFDIDARDGETVARVSIPMSQVRLESLDMISQRIVSEIEALPRFPENIVALQKMIEDPNSEIAEIARQVSTDPSLTADLLKLVNSAQFMLPKKVDNIVEAVKMVGMRGLRNLLFFHGTQKILGNETTETKRLWEHSYRTAFYAYQLARSVTRKKEILDDVYVGGILHDMGKIIFSSVHPELIEKIHGFCREKGIQEEIFEDLAAGLNHSEIGAMIAEKWNFPDALVAAIKYHHTPTTAPMEFRDVVFTVYLANGLTHYGEKTLGIDQLEPAVLKYFNIGSEAQLGQIEQKLDTAFDKANARMYERVSTGNASQSA
ncbi:MAG: HDOD domain-containing protein [Spirochaetes bacterium]|jgi:putative nucleotidyltransferase with HDIG domain|nr:HDOD domain-containing protein [Spirochaetota bacterium]